MGRFRAQEIIDVDEQQMVVHVESEEATDLVEREEDDSDNNAPAFIVAYQRNGTPFLVPYHPPKSKRPTPWWMYISLLCVITQLIVWYGPPAPPPTYSSEDGDSWESFVSRHGTAWYQSTLSLLAILPHVGQWCVSGFVDDVRNFVTPKQPLCTLQLSSIHSSDFWKPTTTTTQSKAMTVTSQALNTWYASEKALILVFSGTVGVGKLFMAQQVAERLICSASRLDLDLAIPHVRQDMSQTIQQHLARRRSKSPGGEKGGMVIILRHAEQVDPPTILVETLRSLAQIPQLVVIVTTHVGSRVIHSHLQNPKDSSSTLLDLELRRELDLSLTPDFSSLASNVVPFVPLGKPELKRVCHDKLETWLSTTFQGATVAVADSLLIQMTSTQRVEYLEWEGLTFSSLGAKVLTPWLDRVFSGLRSCMTEEENLPESSVQLVTLEWDEEEEVVLSFCHVKNEQQVCDEECRFEL